MWGGGLQEAPGGGSQEAIVIQGHRGRWRRPFLFLALPLGVTTVLWAFILSILLSQVSTQQRELQGRQDQLKTNASTQSAMLDAWKEEVRACNSCCLGTQAQLRTARAEFGAMQLKLIQQDSTLKELRELVTQSLAEAGRDREDIRREMFRALDAVRLGNSSCEPCATSWQPFQGSCYLFSALRVPWEEAQRKCKAAGGHLVIVGNMDEQAFLSRNTQGRGYWLGLRALRRASKIQGYRWVDGVPLSFSHWNRGEPNDAQGREDCVMMLPTGFWNDAPCDSERDSWICEKRLSC